MTLKVHLSNYLIKYAEIVKYITTNTNTKRYSEADCYLLGIMRFRFRHTKVNMFAYTQGGQY